jgi:hypothetical protein
MKHARLIVIRHLGDSSDSGKVGGKIQVGISAWFGYLYSRKDENYLSDRYV